MPLGSQSASGSVGKMLTYQGTVVRSYAAGKDKKTTSQVNVRDLFHDLTKTYKTLGPWGRGACRTVFGSRWYTALYKLAKAARTMVIPESVHTGESLFYSFSPFNQAVWRAAAPFKDTKNDAGLIFWLAYLGIFLTVGEHYDLPLFEGEYIAPPTGWWARTLEGVCPVSIWPNELPFEYGAFNSTVASDPLANGGSYYILSCSGLTSWSFYFYGKKCEIEFIRLPTGTTASMILDYGMPSSVTFYAQTTQYGVLYSTGVLTDGLHRLECLVPPGGKVTVDVVRIISPAAEGGVIKSKGVDLVAGVLELMEQTATPSIPGADKSKVFVTPDGVLKLLDHTGVLRSVGTGEGGGGGGVDSVVHVQALFTVEGIVKAGNKPFRIYVPDVGTTAMMEEIYLAANTAPGTTPIRVDVLKNGVSMLEAPGYVELPVGENVALRESPFTGWALAKNDYFTMAIIQGDAVGADLTVHVRYKYILANIIGVIHSQVVFALDGAIDHAVDKPIRVCIPFVGTGAEIEEIFVAGQTAPYSTPVQIDVRKNGVTLFSGVPYVELSPGYNQAVRNIDFATLALQKDDVLQVSVLQGDLMASDLTVHVRYKWTLTGV